MNISDIRIVGIDEMRPPMIRKEDYIDLFFKLSQQAPEDWCEDFNKLGHQVDPPVKIDKTKGLVVETWVRNMTQIQGHLDTIISKINLCNTEYLEKIQLKALADAEKRASVMGMDGEQNKLNKIVAALNYESS